MNCIPGTVAVIPARLESVRLPRKPLLDLCGKPLIQRVYENAVSLGIFESVSVATDSDEIFDVCSRFGCPVLRTRSSHRSGTSRVSEAVARISGDWIVNIQGDEPFLAREPVHALVEELRNRPGVSIATLVYPSADRTLAADPNTVKAVADRRGNALYFSRHPIPFFRGKDAAGSWLLHAGIYAFRRGFLENFDRLETCELERAEKLEQLRFLSNGWKILLVRSGRPSRGIDTPSDLESARRRIREDSHASP
jgi:3-deoxy-manno-octulosonate cytidylyltransferase (CMP-KDO synthetase)